MVNREGISTDLTPKQVRDDRGESDAEMAVVGKAEVRIENLNMIAVDHYDRGVLLGHFPGLLIMS